MHGESQPGMNPAIASEVEAVGAAFRRFHASFPHYARTGKLDALREADFAGPHDHETYLDYAGSGRYGRSQLARHMERLNDSVFGNPHSDSACSQRASRWMNEARARVLRYFQADSRLYTLVFTGNTSGAIKLVGESYPFTGRSTFLQTVDNHNSVNGVREFARARGARLVALPGSGPEMRVRTPELAALLAEPSDAPRLFAYPAQSNFSGVQHPLDWVALAHAHGWDVLIDAASFVSTNRLNLSEIDPDFVALSFYKIFGWPTGLGCLIAKKSALARLKRPWFAGGTVWAASVQGDWHVPAQGHEGFEDGSLNFLSFPAVGIGLDYIEDVGIETIHTRVMCLTGWLLEEIQHLSHANGKALVELYGPRTTDQRGAVITFNCLDPDGHIVDERIVQNKANAWGIAVSVGCFSNPGAGELAFKLNPEALRSDAVLNHKLSFDDHLAVLGMQSRGAIRMSFGLASNFADAYRVLQFLKTFRNDYPANEDLTPRPGC